jgi:predicted MFS family arabinose efflux permease
MSALGTALGPALGGALIAAAGWRAIFLVLVPAGVAAAIVVNRCLPSDRTQPRVAALDFGGMVALALALGAYAMAATAGDDRGGMRPVFAATAVLAGVLFVWIETRARTPIIAPAALRDPALTAGLVMNALVASAMMATLVVGPFYLSRGLGLDFARVGAVMAVGPAIAAFSGVPAGRLTDALGAGRMVIGGLAVMAVGALALAVLPGLAGYIAAMACLTPGYQLFLAANTTAVMGAAGAGRTGTVSGLLSMSRNVGLITGAAVMGAVFARAVGTQDLGAAGPDAIAGGLRITFAVVAGTLAVAAALAVIGQRRRAEA